MSRSHPEDPRRWEPPVLVELAVGHATEKDVLVPTEGSVTVHGHPIFVGPS